MPGILTEALLIGLFLFSGLPEGRTAAPGEQPFSVAAKKRPKKKKARKKKQKKTRKAPSVGIPAFDKTFAHNSALLKIIKKNKNDCAKVVSALSAYCQKNMVEFEKLKMERREVLSGMSAEERAALNKKIQEAMWQVTKGYWGVLEEVDQRCPLNKVDIHMYLKMID